ncbi:MAG: hypothetical protein P0Y56_05720 [Candidatus Andeanibacterium colombiense]|uniref:Uncharacterized protein n=1 Tax=Candidatus Andeanibacterium colombiense TaxID=3121345 RepID=A0AAJ5X909_9SPHN|nr:MAG: hypothetical protein P0Y56_05720 [Sphingomonadaceae bacterium]
MHTYQLVFSEDAYGEAKIVEFDADDAAEALTIAHSESARRNAELWSDAEKLCTIRRSEIGYWEVGRSGAQTGQSGAPG